MVSVQSCANHPLLTCKITMLKVPSRGQPLLKGWPFGTAKGLPFLLFDLNLLVVGSSHLPFTDLGLGLKG